MVSEGIQSHMLERIVLRLNRVSGPDTKGWWTALCAFHNDKRRPNLRFNQRGFRCMACGERGTLAKLAKQLGISDGPLTLAQYATAKRLPEGFLRDLGLRDSTNGLRIPYMDESGQEVAVRFRHCLTGARRFSWRKGDHPLFYGLWRLPGSKGSGYVVLVEGESNCHTLWYHGFPAVGIPGASAWQPAWARQLVGIPTICLVQDPDDAGGALGQRLASDLGERLRVVQLSGLKDVSELHLADPSAFPERFREAVAQAVPYAQGATLSAAEAAEGLALLRDPHLIERIAQDLEAMGLVGERNAGLLQYLVATSRRAPRPLGSALRNPSAYGKTTLVRKVGELMPPDEVADLSRLTPQALHYWEQGGLRHKWLIIQDIATSEGLSSARVLFSDNGLQVAYPAKDSSGRLTTIRHKVEGPVAYTDAGVAPLTDVQDSSRFLEVPLDGSKNQTERVQDQVRWEVTPEGLRQRKLRRAVIRRHRSAQQLLRPGLEVVVPYAPLVRFPSETPRHRRDLARFLALVQAVAFLCQYQRTIREEEGAPIIEADLEDYRVAYGLFRSLAEAVLNDLNPHSLSLLEGIRAHYQAGGVFTRQELSAKLDARPTFVRDYIGPLLEAGFLEELEKGGRGKPYTYRLMERTPAAMAISTPEEIAEALKLARKMTSQEGGNPSPVIPSKSGE